MDETTTEIASNSIDSAIDYDSINNIIKNLPETTSVHIDGFYTQVTFRTPLK